MRSPHFAPSGRPALADPFLLDAAGGAPHTVLDALALARLAELDPTGEMQLLERVLKTFQTSAAKFTAQLEAARTTGDRPAIRLVAHTLKSSSGYIGAVQLARDCAELEAASDRADHPDLAPEIDAMIASLRQALAAVSRRLGAR